jgi:oxygen-dependent protoporphyrinogen oxidase
VTAPGGGHDVVVVGGGVAGLTCALRLGARGLDVVVLERGDEPGGNVRTHADGGFRIEWGPHTFLGSADHVFDLVDDLALAGDLCAPRPAAKARFIARGGRLHAAPSGPWSFLTTRLLSGRAKWQLATEPLRPSRGEESDTAAMFFARRFGPEAARVLAGAFVAGVYAGDPDALSAAAAFPLFWGFEQETGSMVRGALRHARRRKAAFAARGLEPRRGLFSFTGGLGRLTAALGEALGPRLRLGVPVDRVARDGAGGYVVEAGAATWRARAAVVATPPGPAAGLLRGLDADLATLLDGIPMAPVAVVSLGYDERVGEVPDGFGFLAPRGEGVRSLGVLFPSRLFGDRAPAGGDLFAGFVGGVADRAALALDDDALVAIVRGDLERLTGATRSPTFTRVRRHPTAIPQLVVGHLERLRSVAARLAAHPGLCLAGNYLKGVGLKDAAASGVEAAASVASALGAAPAEPSPRGAPVR